MSHPEHKKRSVGRPKDSSADAARAALITAASTLFSRKGYAATKISELAAEAGVTPAMVHYYFGGKEKLLEAVLEEAFDPLIAQIEATKTLDAWAKAFHGHLLARRWLPHLMQREVLMEGGHLQQLFLERYASKLAPKWISMIAAEKAAGRMRADASEARHMVLIMALLVHPFLIGKIETNLHGGAASEEALVQFRDDALLLFREGTKPRSDAGPAQ